MNQPLISPWIFYALSVLEPILIIACTVSVFTGAFWVLAIANDEKKIAKRLGITCIISILFVIFVPGRHTIIQMYIASKITPANINTAAELGEKAVDKTIEKILEASRKYHEVTHGNHH